MRYLKLEEFRKVSGGDDVSRFIDDEEEEEGDSTFELEEEEEEYPTFP